MAFRNLIRRLLVADISMGVLLAVSYIAMLAADVTPDPATYVIIKLGTAVLLVNFLLLSGVLYTGWEPV